MPIHPVIKVLATIIFEYPSRPRPINRRSLSFSPARIRSRSRSRVLLFRCFDYRARVRFEYQPPNGEKRLFMRRATISFTTKFPANGWTKRRIVSGTRNVNQELRSAPRIFLLQRRRQTEGGEEAEKEREQEGR